MLYYSGHQSNCYMFTSKHQPYQMCDSSLLEQSRYRTTKFGLRSISHIGTKLWNDLPDDFKGTTNFTDFKSILQTWAWPDFDKLFPLLCISIIWYPRQNEYDDVITWKHFPRYWPFVRGIHLPSTSPHKGHQWRGALMFSLIRAWTYDWANDRDAVDLRCHRAHYGVTVMISFICPRCRVTPMCCSRVHRFTALS